MVRNRVIAWVWDWVTVQVIGQVTVQVGVQVRLWVIMWVCVGVIAWVMSRVSLWVMVVGHGLGYGQMPNGEMVIVTLAPFHHFTISPFGIDIEQNGEMVKW